MINYQLANGKTIRLSDEQYFKMSDQDLKDLEGTSYGFMANDPFYDSILGGNIYEEIDIMDIELPDIQELPLDFEEEEE